MRDEKEETSITTSSFILYKTGKGDFEALFIK
jgi:hypothetical protein